MQAERSKGSGASGVDYTLWDTLMIKAMNLVSVRLVHSYTI